MEVGVCVCSSSVDGVVDGAADDVLDGKGCRVATAALRSSSERDIKVQR